MLINIELKFFCISMIFTILSGFAFIFKVMTDVENSNMKIGQWLLNIALFGLLGMMLFGIMLIWGPP